MRERCVCGGELETKEPPTGNIAYPDPINQQWALWRDKHWNCMNVWSQSMTPVVLEERIG